MIANTERIIPRMANVFSRSFCRIPQMPSANVIRKTNGKAQIIESGRFIGLVLLGKPKRRIMMMPIPILMLNDAIPNSECLVSIHPRRLSASNLMSVLLSEWAIRLRAWMITGLRSGSSSNRYSSRKWIPAIRSEALSLESISSNSSFVYMTPTFDLGIPQIIHLKIL
jgi:hypothetical protein